MNEDLENLEIHQHQLATHLSKVNEEIKLLQEERIKLLEGIWNTPPAETLETPPILDTHGANNQGMREEPSHIGLAAQILRATHPNNY